MTDADRLAREQEPALLTYMTTTDPVKRDAAFLRTYAARVRDGSAFNWEIPSTVAGTIEVIAARLEVNGTQLAAERQATNHWFEEANRDHNTLIKERQARERLEQLLRQWDGMVEIADADDPIPGDEAGYASRWEAVRMCADELRALLRGAGEKP